jgi:hypothetical protein
MIPIAWEEQEQLQESQEPSISLGRQRENWACAHLNAVCICHGNSRDGRGCGTFLQALLIHSAAVTGKNSMVSAILSECSLNLQDAEMTAHTSITSFRASGHQAPSLL